MNPLTLQQLCGILAERGLTVAVEGADCLVHGVNTLEDAAQGEVAFLSNEKYLTALGKTKASAVFAKPGIAVPDGVSALRCDDPYAAVTVAIIAIHGHRIHPQWGVSARAEIDESADIGGGANIAGGVTISADVTVGENCTFYPGCFIGPRVSIGDDCTLYPNAVVYDDCVLGDRVTVHAGSVIGEDGLGYAPYEGAWVKIPQVGRAILHDDVEIGANCAIDRATLGQTEVGAGSKFGNVVVIGHGTKVGRGCMFVGIVGVAGSTHIGDSVTVAGHVGVNGHINIGDRAKVGAKSGVSSDVKPDSVVLGSPAAPIHETRRSMIIYQRLPKWTKRITQLERQVAELKKQLDAASSL